ncbi:hypothetical protein BGZ73_003065 [Actinomortierella ambigua]|nr:hypothetical protein BGZ73_003065 [Actinomortierella ambigua]
MIRFPNLECLAKDETTMTLYGLAVVNNYRPTDTTERLVLLKSNEYPTSVDNLSWTVVSTTPLGANDLPYMYGKMSDGGITCAVDPTGVFVAFSYSAGKSARAQTPASPGGVRYNPGHPPLPGSTGQGAWYGINASTDYRWSPDKMRSILFPVKEDTNKYSFRHIYMNSLSGIHIGSLGSTSNTFTLVVPDWKPAPTLGTNLMVAYSSGILYTVHSNGINGVSLGTSQISGASIPDTFATDVKTPLPNTCNGPNTYLTALPRNRLALVCMNPSKEGSVLYRFNGNALESAAHMRQYFTSRSASEALEGAQNGQSFMFMHDSDNSTALSISLESSRAGEIQYPGLAPTIKDTTTPAPGSNRGTAASDGLSASHIGAIVGGLVGLATLAIGLVQWRRRRIRAAREARFEEKKTPPTDPAGEEDDAAAPSPNMQYETRGPYPAPSLPEMATHPRPQVFTTLAESSQPGGGPEAILGQDPTAVPLPPGPLPPIIPPRPHLPGPLPSNQFVPQQQYQQHQHYRQPDNEEVWTDKVPYNSTDRSMTGSSASLSNPQALTPPAPYEYDGTLTFHAAIVTAAGTPQQQIFIAPNFLGTTPSTGNLAHPAFTVPPAVTPVDTTAPVQYHPSLIPSASSPLHATSSSNTATAAVKPAPVPVPAPAPAPAKKAITTKVVPPAYPAATRPAPNNPHTFTEPHPPKQPAGATTGTSYAEFHDDDGDVPLLDQHSSPSKPVQQLPYSDLSGSTLGGSSMYSGSPIQSSAATVTTSESWSPKVPNHTRPPRHPQLQRTVS